MRLLRALLLVILGGFAGLIAAAAVLKRALPSSGDADSDELALVAILDGVELESRSQSFRGGRILAWFGGVALDLREATLASGARLSVHSLFGGVAIRVPPDWRIESGMSAIAGGVDVATPEAEADGPTLTLTGLALFGGIAVGARVADGAFPDEPTPGAGASP